MIGGIRGIRVIEGIKEIEVIKGDEGDKGNRQDEGHEHIMHRSWRHGRGEHRVSELGSYALC